MAPGETSEAALLEAEFAAWQGARYCLACTSGGSALHIALRAAGVGPGDIVLANAFTLAPVPGAIHNAGATPLFVEIGADWLIDLDDLAAKAGTAGAKALLLSHMRGHVADMEQVTAICDRHGLVLIEDCAHTMGARWNGRRSGNFGRVACFSSQTYKHLNAGEGGLLTTDDPEIAARAILYSGSYMLYGRHGAAPPEAVFEAVRLDVPNFSNRMDNMRAALIRLQLPSLEDNIRRWNVLYAAFERAFRAIPALVLPARPQGEAYVGSSIQFHVDPALIPALPAVIADCAALGVDLKWFGADAPVAFTSRYDSWRYVASRQHLPRTLEALSTTCDLRLPLTFVPDDAATVAAVLAHAVRRHLGTG